MANPDCPVCGRKLAKCSCDMGKIMHAVDELDRRERLRQTWSEIGFLLWRLRLPKRLKKKWTQEGLMDYYDRCRKTRCW